MDFLEYAYTKPYLMSLSPSGSMDVALLARPNVQAAFIEYGTERPDTRVEARRFHIDGLRIPAYEWDYDPVPENNPPLPVDQFIFPLKNLQPGQRYFYRVTLETADGPVQGNIYDFKTAPSGEGDYSFALMSDLQLFKPCDHTVFQIGQRHPDFILYAGDMANSAWRAVDWFTVPGAWQEPRRRGMAFFDILQREDGGARLLQYAPVFPCPGNHETDDQRCEMNKAWARDPGRYTLRTYMQLFRTYYPDQEYGWDGKHWYALDYGDMHIVSLNVVRCCRWNPYEAPGLILRGGELSPESPQGRWLQKDLSESRARFKWVVMHWHMMNRGEDTQPLLCDPVPDKGDPERVVYPRDLAGEFLHPLFRDTGVNAVNYGHSHVYERYLIDGVHYIEAAYMGVKYGRSDGEVNPSGIYPVNQMHDFRSYMIITHENGRLRAVSRQASFEPNGYGCEGRVFDAFDIG